jgi:hypothetical protein
LAATLPALPCIEALGGGEQRCANTPPAYSSKHEHLREVAAMRLVLRLIQNDLNGADDVPAASSAASTTRSPRATLADMRRQYASALARDIGSMKLTDAPPSTQSISTSLNPWISPSPMV